MNRFTCFHSLAIAAVMLPFTGSLVFADPLTLIEKGQPRAEIIIAEKPPRMVNLAAFELQRYLHKITKARLPIVHEPNFTEEDVRAGEPVSGKSRLRGEVARLLHSTTNSPPDRP